MIEVVPLKHSGWERDTEWERSALRQFDAWPPDVQRPTCFRRNLLAAIVGREPVGGEGEDSRWHISVSHRSRVPDWSEMQLLVVQVFDEHAAMYDALKRIEILTRNDWRQTQIHELARNVLKDVA